VKVRPAILGLALGSLVGLWQSYRFFVTDKALRFE
jgi:hypothetical protein